MWYVVLVMVLPGLIALKSGEPEKVAKFMENLQARDLTVDELPTSLREELKSFSHKWELIYRE